MVAQHGQTVDCSIVIPTYNRAPLLEQTLTSLTHLQVPSGARVEVLVCDDGSSDATFEVTRRFEAALNLHYCYQPDLGHRVAAARNMGIALARGRLLLLLDCGVLAAPSLVKEHLLAHSLADRPAFVSGPMWGYHAEADEVLAGLEAGSADIWAHVASSGMQADPRSVVWQEVDYRLDRLSAPWSLGWSTNISMPRAAVLAVGAFDEKFEGWGAEDIDLAYRLYVHGLSFRVNPEAMTIHLPHEESESDYDSNYYNKKLLFSKAPSLETELLPAFGTRLYSQRLDEIRAVATRALMPDYLLLWDDAFKEVLQTSFEGPHYLFGGGTGELAEFLDCTFMSEPDPAKVKRAQLRYPWLDIRNGLGVTTTMASHAVGTAIITDFWRAFSASVTVELIKEAERIARRTIVFFTPGARVPAVLNAPAWETGQLLEELSKAGLSMVELLGGGPTSVYEVARLEPRS